MAERLSRVELENREYVARNALATMRLERLEPPHDAMDLVGRYAAGDLTEEKFFNAIERLLDPGGSESEMPKPSLR